MMTDIFTQTPAPSSPLSHHKKASCGPNVEYQCKKSTNILHSFGIHSKIIDIQKVLFSFYLIFYIPKIVFRDLFLSKWLALALPNKVINIIFFVKLDL